MVLQETWLKSATIHDNIAYANPKASRDEVIEAAKAANADFFIRQLPNGYDVFRRCWRLVITGAMPAIDNCSYFS